VKKTILLEENENNLPQIRSQSNSRQPSRQQQTLKSQRRSLEKFKTENPVKPNIWKEGVNEKLAELLRNLKTINVTSGDQPPLFQKLNITPKYLISSVRNNTLKKTKELFEEADKKVLSFRNKVKANPVFDLMF